MPPPPATTSIAWVDGTDIHLLRGSEWAAQSENLRFCTDAGKPVFSGGAGGSIPADVNPLKFDPNLVGAVANQLFTGHGVTVKTDTGQVAALLPYTPPTGVPELRNFQVRARGGALVSSPLRFHVHRSIQDVWLSPRVLTIRKDVGMRGFSVFVKFDDGVVADIRNWHDHLYVNSTNGRTLFSWASSNPAAVEVSGAGHLFCVAAAPTTVDITLTLPPELGGKSATAQVKTTGPWSAPTQAFLVQGGSETKIEDRINILFVPDGFVASEEKAFAHIVERIVTTLQTHESTRPYGVVKDSINYWRAWVPSPERGVTLLDEYRFIESKGVGEEVPAPRKPRSANPANVAELFNEVGLPVPVDDGGTAGPAQAAKVAGWKKLYKNPSVDQIEPGLYKLWKSFATRTLVNERDTAFAITLGNRPGAQGLPVEMLDFNSNRTAPEEGFETFLDNVFATVKDQGGTQQQVAIGKRWLPGGKDHGFVCIIARGTQLGGQETERCNGATLLRYTGKENEPLKKAPAGQKGIDHDPPAIKNDFEPVPWVTITIAHEFGHTFRLADEYGEGGCTEKNTDDVIAARPNIQSRSTLLTGTKIDPSKIKWAQWFRTRKAGVLAEALTASGGGYTIKLRSAAEAERFKAQDVVRLRHRNLCPDGKTDPTHLPDPLTSVKLKVTAVATDTVTVTPVDPFPATEAAKYPKGSVLFLPAREKTQTPGSGAELMLIAPAIRDWLNTSQQPLNAKNNQPCQPDSRIAVDELPALNLPDPPPKGKKAVVFSGDIIGLYDGGGNWGCGVFHPAGVCVMRGRESGHRPFCQVCAYVIVNHVDPTMLPALDDEYDPYYPGPEREPDTP